jgi:hypothetical protein
MQPLRLVFSFDHLTSALFGPSTSLNAPSLADPRCRRFSAPDHTQTLLPLPLLPFQNPPALLPLLPFPKSSGSTEGSQSSGPEGKNRFHPKFWVTNRLALAALGAVGGSLATVGSVRAGSFLCHLKHADYQRVLPNLSPSQSGENGTKNLREVNTNLHANLQSTISSKRDRYLRRRLNTLSHANPLSRK